MVLQLVNLKIPVDKEAANLKKLAARKMGIPEHYIKDIEVSHRSVDARDKKKIFFIYSLKITLDDQIPAKLLARALGTKDIKEVTNHDEYDIFANGPACSETRPIVVGSGPAGLFSAWVLAKSGLKPIILERGKRIEDRVIDVDRFWTKGELLPESNVQFGEGGAGTFSDGKLTTRINDPRVAFILKVLVEHGASEDIRWQHRPHIGTDRLRHVIISLRKEIISLGGEFFFSARMESIETNNNKIRSIRYGDGDVMPANHVILALGNSARDTWKRCYECGIELVAKPFAMGVRIEHLQQDVDRSQLGEYSGHRELSPADYQFVFQDRETGRGVYTFCMCPGGNVIGAASEPGMVAINGMSYHSRSGKNANSALVVEVKCGDFFSNHPLAGVEYQQYWEKKAYTLAGCGFLAPVQTVGDFLNDRLGDHLPDKIKPTYMPGVTQCRLTECLPTEISASIKRSLSALGARASFLSDMDAIMTGVETRTSSPVRMLRDQSGQSNILGIFPAGEGSGYAGGIISAAVDGLKAAEKLLQSL